VGTRAYMLNQELRFPLLTYLTLGTPFGDVTFPEIQGGLFADVGKALLHSDSNRALLGSYGISYRLALGPLAVLRLDVGRRFTDRRYQGYSLSGDQKTPAVVHFFFGYNY
jgi:hypothetical protein